MIDPVSAAELANVTAALLDALREAHDLALGGEYGAPLREVLRYAKDLQEIAGDFLGGAGEGARGMHFEIGERLDALRALLADVPDASAG